MKLTIIHVRAQRGPAGTLCGAPLTDRDLTPANARQALGDPAWAPRMCADCVRAMRRE